MTDSAAIDILTTVNGAKHSIVAWFEIELEGHMTRFAAMFQDPANADDAREWLMRGSVATRRLLADRKAPYHGPTDGPLFCQNRRGERPVIVASGARLPWVDEWRE